jgi:signal transduction histidine kinase
MQTLQETVPLVGEMITSNDLVRPRTIVNHVAELFFSTTRLEAVALVDDGEPVGLVTRTKLMFTLFRRFGFELYGKDPIVSIAEPDPLIVTGDERLDAVIDRALERPPQDVYDEIIVADGRGCYRGLLSVKQLVIQQGNALANSRLQKEMASERAREFEKISEIKSQFLAHITHELRSPVNVIIGLAELMRLAIDKGSVDQVRDRLSQVISSATNLRSIVTNVLDLSKIEAKKMQVSIKPFDLAAVVSDVIENARVLVRNKPVTVDHAGSAGPLPVLSDPVRVRQILMNLAANAAKFTESGSILFAISAGTHSVSVSVIDTGIGIKEEHLCRLFAAFSQLEDAKTKRYEGTGLGLVIARSMAHLLGGELTVASTYGKGSTFTLTLPYSEPHEEETHVEAQKDHGH